MVTYRRCGPCGDPPPKRASAAGNRGTSPLAPLDLAGGLVTLTSVVTSGTGTPGRRLRKYLGHSPAPDGDLHDVHFGTRAPSRRTRQPCTRERTPAPTANPKPAPPQARPDSSTSNRLLPARNHLPRHPRNRGSAPLGQLEAAPPRGASRCEGPGVGLKAAGRQLPGTSWRAPRSVPRAECLGAQGSADALHGEHVRSEPSREQHDLLRQQAVVFHRRAAYELIGSGQLQRVHP